MKSEKVKVESEQQRVDSVHEQIVMVVYDTVREVTTITVKVSEEGDTLRTDRVSDRKVGELVIRTEKLTVLSDEKQAVSDTVVVHDSIYIANGDVASEGGTTRRNVNGILWWVFAIICALGGLVFMIKKK